MKLFHRGKPEALVFVDFEYMEISFKKRYGIHPPVWDWYKELCETYDIAELYVFADFSNPAMKYNLPELRKITNHIIETQNTASYHKKDFTDFFILDQIYQKALEKHRAGTYILFTGDGHFGAVSRFLMTKCHKEVRIYGIEGNISGTLRSQATEVIEFPTYEKLKTYYYPVIAEKMEELGTSGQRKAEHLSVPHLVRLLTEEQNLRKDALEDAVEDMLSRGYLHYKEQWINSLKRVRVLACDREKLKADGIL